MIKLKKFYELVSRTADVTLTEKNSKRVCYRGNLKDIPDRFDECVVDDFRVSNEGSFTFILKAGRVG